MLNLSLAAILEKNKIARDSIFFILIEMTIPNGNSPDIIRVVHNNEDITWNGQLWQALPFKLGEINEDSKELPSISLQICNIGGELQEYLEETQGAVDATVILRIVNSKNLDSNNYELEETFSVTQTSSDVDWITFTLGADFGLKSRITDIYLKDFCNHKFKDIRCGYNGTEASCSHNYLTCRIKERFGGEIALQGGVYNVQ